MTIPENEEEAKASVVKVLDYIFHNETILKRFAPQEIWDRFAAAFPFIETEGEK